MKNCLMRELLLVTSLVFGIIQGSRANASDFFIDSLRTQIQVTNSPIEKSNHFNSLGIAYGYKNEPEKSLQCFIASAKILESIGDTTLLHHRYLNIGLAYGIHGGYEEGLDYMYRSIPLCNAMKDTITLGLIYQNIGSTYEYIGELDSAKRYINKAYEINIHFHDTLSMASAMNTLGLIAENQEQPDSMLYYLQKGLEYARTYDQSKFDERAKMRMAITLESLYHNIGKYYARNGPADSAIFYLERVLNFNSDYTSMDAKMTAHKHLGDVYMKRKSFEQACYHFNQELNMKDSLFDERREESIYEMQVKYETEKVNMENKELKLTASLAEAKKKLADKQYDFALMVTWSVVLVLFLALLIIFFLFKQNKTIRQLNMRLNTTNEELTSAKQKVELKALLNQINPHFIFNSLNSIQQFIVKNDVGSSTEYFGSFGRLIRHSLDHSEREFVPIQEEIEVIQDYSTLENLRFKQPFELIINPGNVDVYSIKIPPMFIQPLVENSINHGFAQEKPNKRIEISFQEFDESIQCSVKDNGIGYYTSQKKSEGRNSGLNISSNRLRSIWKNSGKMQAINIKELTDGDGNATGTIVSIYLPKSF